MRRTGDSATATMSAAVRALLAIPDGESVKVVMESRLHAAGLHPDLEMWLDRWDQISEFRKRLFVQLFRYHVLR